MSGRNCHEVTDGRANETRRGIFSISSLKNLLAKPEARILKPLFSKPEAEGAVDLIGDEFVIFRGKRKRRLMEGTSPAACR